MSLFVPNKIELEYSPKITIEKIKLAIAKHLPDYKQFRPFGLELRELFLGDSIAIKRRGATAMSLISIKNNEKSNRTTIRIQDTYRIGGLLFYMATKKDSIERIEEAIRLELPNMIQE